MAKKEKNSGFSLTEVLMAVGILSIGLMLVAMMFPLGMHLTAVAAERTIASALADQAFAKVRLYGVDTLSLTVSNKCYDFSDVSQSTIDPGEFAYPAMDSGGKEQYYWSAICRKVNDGTVQVTVFVSRKRGAGLTYTDHTNTTYNRPVPVKVSIPSSGGDELSISSGDEGRIIPGCTIVDDKTGKMYRVIEREGNVVTLAGDWDNGMSDIWVVAPPDSGGADPAIAVFQKVIKF